MPSAPNMRPHDVVVLLALAHAPQATYRALAVAAGVSVGGAHASVTRLSRSRLLLPGSRRLNTQAAESFLLHGVPYVFPGEIGPQCRGVPTAYSAPPLSALLEGGTPVVWPSRDGEVRGDSLVPLSSSAPSLAASNPGLYQLLAAVDALRIGRAREREFGRQFVLAALRRLSSARLA